VILHFLADAPCHCLPTILRPTSGLRRAEREIRGCGHGGARGRNTYAWSGGHEATRHAGNGHSGQNTRGDQDAGARYCREVRTEPLSGGAQVTIHEAHSKSPDAEVIQWVLCDSGQDPLADGAARCRDALPAS